MKKTLKWTALALGSLLLLVAAALLLLPRFVDVQRYKPIIEKQVAEATGRPFTIGDDLTLSLFPWAGVTLSDLKLGNPEGFGEESFLTVAGFEARLKLLPLLSREIQVKRFVVREPRLNLIRRQDGKVNWTLGPTGKAPKTAPAPAPESPPPSAELNLKSLTVEEFAVTGGTLAWTDQTTGQRHAVTDIRLILDQLALGQPVQMDFAAQVDGKPLALQGQVGPLSTNPDGQPLTFDLTVKALGEMAVTLQGRVQPPLREPQVEARLAVPDFSPRRLFAALGGTLPLTPADDKALQRLGMEMELKASPRQVEARKGVLRLDDTRLDFSLQVRDLAKPAIQVEARGDALDLDRYLPQGGSPETPGPASPPPSGGTAPRKPVDYAPLRRLELDARLDLGRLKVRNAQIQNLRLQVRGANGRFDIDSLQAELYQGTVQTKGAVDFRRAAPQSQLTVAVAGVQAGPLVQDLLQKNLIEGRMQADMDLRMAGDAPEAIRRSLNGRGALTFTNGALVGIDLLAMVRNVQAAFGKGEMTPENSKTEFTELAIPFTLTDGVFATQGSRLTSPFLRTEATGQADLARETLDFRVQPTLVNALKGQGAAEERAGVMVPVLVSGTFDQPHFAPDLKAIARQQMEEKVLESDKVKEVFEKNPELKPLEETAKGLLKGLLKD